MEHELYHYGVLGMKWGVRRTRQQLSDRVYRLSSKNKKLTGRAGKMDNNARLYDEKSTRLISRNSKYENMLVKATAKKAKYDVKLTKELSRKHPNEDKIAKYTVKSSKYGHKIDKAKRRLVYNKWYVKSQEAKTAAAKTRAKIEKNEKLMSVYNNTIKAMDNGQIEQGRLFMKYVFDE